MLPFCLVEISYSWSTALPAVFVLLFEGTNGLVFSASKKSLGWRSGPLSTPTKRYNCLLLFVNSMSIVSQMRVAIFFNSKTERFHRIGKSAQRSGENCICTFLRQAIGRSTPAWLAIFTFGIVETGEFLVICIRVDWSLFPAREHHSNLVFFIPENLTRGKCLKCVFEPLRETKIILVSVVRCDQKFSKKTEVTKHLSAWCFCFVCSFRLNRCGVFPGTILQWLPGIPSL